MNGSVLPCSYGDLINRITDYLAIGGLVNPEMMEHEKVRDLLIDCRDALSKQNEKGLLMTPPKSNKCNPDAMASFAAPTGSAWEADYKCNLCGQITRRKTLRWRTWLPSYCEKSGKLGRLYRLSTKKEVNR